MIADRPTIREDARGRFVVADSRRVYGAYRTLYMANYRLTQVVNSRRPPRRKGA